MAERRNRSPRSMTGGLGTPGSKRSSTIRMIAGETMQRRSEKVASKKVIRTSDRPWRLVFPLPLEARQVWR